MQGDGRVLEFLMRGRANETVMHKHDCQVEGGLHMHSTLICACLQYQASDKAREQGWQETQQTQKGGVGLLWCDRRIHDEMSSKG